MKNFLYSMLDMNKVESSIRNEILNRMENFFRIQKDFLCFSRSIKNKPAYEGKFMDLNKSLFKLDFLIIDTIDFFTNVNRLIFDILDGCGGVNLDFFVPKKNFSKFYKEHLVSVRELDDCIQLLECINNSRSYAVNILNDSFFEKKIFPDSRFLNFKESCYSFTESISVYEMVCEKNKSDLIAYSLRDINLHMMSMINFLEDFRLAIGVLWLYI